MNISLNQLKKEMYVDPADLKPFIRHDLKTGYKHKMVITQDGSHWEYLGKKKDLYKLVKSK